MLHQQWTYFVLAACWIVLTLAWLIGAIYNSRKAPPVQKQVRSSSVFLRSSVFLIGTAIVLLLRLLIPKGIWAYITFNMFWLQIIGVVILIAATVFALWARWTLGTMWSLSTEAKVGHQLHTTGPYRLTRHPIYTGILTMLLGTALLLGLGPWLLYFIVGVIVFEVKLSSEERLMKETFGEQYLQYQQHVPQVVPGLQFFKRRQQ